MAIRLFALVAGAALSLAIAPAKSIESNAVDQGPNWTQALRTAFYAVDQGSRMMPLAWLKALRQADGTPFLADGLVRYGYLPTGDADGLPVGFNVASTPQGPTVGMTCAACHTREIVAQGKVYRIDGGPAFADFGAFMGDLDASMARTLAGPETFATFARDVLGPGASTAAVATLRGQAQAWQARDHAWLHNSFPHLRPWGPGRLDAIAMIFNRLAGLDLGSGPDGLIVDNIREADAPTRYPFLWNSPRQDVSQWAGFTENGNDQLAIARNLGELYGVFGAFHPTPLPAPAPSWSRNYLAGNSANFVGLGQAEGMVRRMGAPVWPWPVDAALAAKGKAIFARPAAEGGCAECHAAVPGAPRPPATDTLRTRVVDVGTDTRQWQVLQRAVKTGALAGAALAPNAPPLRPVDSSLGLLRLAVVGTLQQVQAASAKAPPPPPAAMMMEGVMQMRRAPAPSGPPAAAKPLVNAYEARALPGIWAAAPYLHNGTVPTLADLLMPPAQRPHALTIGPAYDLEKVGLAATQPGARVTIRTTDCSDRASGDSVCGHEYGTRLPPADKRALLEYLKTL